MKKFILFLTLSTAFLCNTVFGQWTQIGYLVIGPDTANSVGTFKGFGPNMYAASNKGLFRSMDNGNTWSGLTYTTAVTQTLTMQSVWEESVSVIYAGSDKRLYKSVNSGSSWTWIPLSIDSVSINEIQRSGSNLVFSYNKSFNKGGAFYSSNNGVTWNLSVGIPTANPMYDLHVEGDTVYIAGAGGIYRSLDKGVNFAFLGNGTNVGLRTITRHASKLFAGDVGGTGMYVSTNGGVTWSFANSSVFAGFCQIFSVTQSPGMIIATMDGGSSCNGGNPVKASVDGGVNWSPFMTGLTTGFYPKTGANGNLTSFFTNKGNKIYRTNASTGIQNYNSAQEVKLFFDAERNLNIQIANSTNLDLKIFSMAGSLLYESEFSGSEIKISELADAATGIYFVMLSSGNKVITQKVLKQE